MYQKISYVAPIEEARHSSIGLNIYLGIFIGLIKVQILSEN